MGRKLDGFVCKYSVSKTVENSVKTFVAIEK